MFKYSKAFIKIIIFVISFFFVISLFSDEMQCLDIVKKLLSVEFPKDIVLTGILKIDKGGETIEKNFTIKYADVHGKKFFINFNNDAGDTATFVSIERKKGKYKNYMHLNKMGLKEVKGIQEAGVAVNFDFLMGFISKDILKKFTYNRLEDKVVNEEACYVVESLPSQENKQIKEKTKIAIRKDIMYPIEIQMYDNNNRPIRKISLLNIVKTKNIYFPKLITIKDKKLNTLVNISINDLIINSNLSEKEFTLNGRIKLAGAYPSKKNKTLKASDIVKKIIDMPFVKDAILTGSFLENSDKTNHFILKYVDNNKKFILLRLFIGESILSYLWTENNNMFTKKSYPKKEANTELKKYVYIFESLLYLYTHELKRLTKYIRLNDAVVDGKNCYVIRRQKPINGKKAIIYLRQDNLFPVKIVIINSAKKKINQIIMKDIEKYGDIFLAKNVLIQDFIKKTKINISLDSVNLNTDLSESLFKYKTLKKRWPEQKK